MTNKSNPKKNKHLTSEDRTEIQECLNRRMSFKDIARLLGKDPTTISYEVKHHRMEHKSGFSSLDVPCPSLLKAPFVCNGCPKRLLASCRYIRFLYNAGKLEGLNNKIKVAKRVAYGYRNDQYFFSLICYSTIPSPTKT